MKQFDSFLVLLDNYKIKNDDIETLHKLRVSSRKLSSVLKKKSMLARKLKTLRKLSNEIRDLDVLKDEFFTSLTNSQQKKLLKYGLDDYIKNKKDILEFEFLLFLRSIKWVETSVKISKKSIDETVETNNLEIPSQNGDELHKFRIKVKKLRYRLEHTAQEENKNIDLLKKMQNLSGKIHDLDVALTFLEDFLDENRFIEFSKIFDTKRKDLYEKLLTVLQSYQELKSA